MLANLLDDLLGAIALGAAEARHRLEKFLKETASGEKSAIAHLRIGSIDARETPP